MTIADIETVLAEIVRLSDDNEEAHALEDLLHQDVLRAIADGAANGAELAAAALRSKDIEYNRWFS